MRRKRRLFFERLASVFTAASDTYCILHFAHAIPPHRCQQSDISLPRTVRARWQRQKHGPATAPTPRAQAPPHGPRAQRLTKRHGSTPHDLCDRPRRPRQELFGRLAFSRWRRDATKTSWYFTIDGRPAGRAGARHYPKGLGRVPAMPVTCQNGDQGLSVDDHRQPRSRRLRT